MYLIIKGFKIVDIKLFVIVNDYDSRYAITTKDISFEKTNDAFLSDRG